jgi:magnesium-transporting ATPase (P-type)
MTTCSAHCWTATGAAAARVSPEDKLRIAQALRRRGHVVAMTGDGVNDAPALSEAAIGVAMGQSGTDVAREAADLVLLDDDFATIVAAVDQGRSTFSNVCRFLTNHLTDNGAELTPFVVWALSGGPFPLAIGVLQILALDIGTDVLPSLALGAEPPAPGVLERSPIRHHLLDGRLFARVFRVLGPAEAVFGLAAFVAVFVTDGWRPGDAFPGVPRCWPPPAPRSPRWCWDRWPTPSPVAARRCLRGWWVGRPTGSCWARWSQSWPCWPVPVPHSGRRPA